MNTLYHAEAKIDDLRRNAEQERLAALVQAGHQSHSVTFYENGRRYLGQGLIWLGSRLHEPVCQPAQPVTQCGPTLALRECV